MKEYVWFFPIIFMFHDMEEIIGFKFFLRKNKTDLESRFPFILRCYKNFSTEGFSLAVYEELILCILISTLAYFLDYNFLWYIWLGAFIGCDLHFFIHLIQVSIYRRYIPACLTSLICLPVNTLILCKCFITIENSILFAGLFMAAGAIMVFANIFIAQKLMGWFTTRFSNHVWFFNKKNIFHFKPIFLLLVNFFKQIQLQNGVFFVFWSGDEKG